MTAITRLVTRLTGSALIAVALATTAVAESNVNVAPSASQPGVVQMPGPDVRVLVRYPDCPTVQFQMVQKSPSLVRCRIQASGNWAMVLENAAKQTPCNPTSYWTQGPTVWKSAGYVNWKCEH